MKRYVSKVLSALLVTILTFNLMIDYQKTYADSQSMIFTETTVVLMPEYNKHPNEDINEPNLLVGFHGTLLNESQEATTEIEIPIPAGESNFSLSLVASPLPGEVEGVKELKHKVNEQADTLTLIFDEAIQPGSTQKIMIEYFYTPIGMNEGVKSFAYDFKAFADAENMNLIVFEPYMSKDFTAVPESDKQATDSMLVKMHLYEYQGIKQGDTNSYEFTYKKDDNLTTIEKVEQITSESITNESNGEGIAAANDSKNNSFFSSDVIFALILITIVALGFVIWFVKKGRGNKSNGTGKALSKTHLGKKELRKMLTEGEINEEQYIKELKKLG